MTHTFEKRTKLAETAFQAKKKCVNHENPKFSMSNCQNKPSLRELFLTIIQILFTFRVLSQELVERPVSLAAHSSTRKMK